MSATTATISGSTGMPGVHATEPSTSQVRRAAVVGGTSLLLLAILAAVANFAVVERLVVDGDAVATTKAIVANEQQFRLAVAAFTAAMALDVVVAWALRDFFAPVDHAVATLGGWMRLAYAALFAVAISHLAIAANLVSSTSGEPALDPAQQVLGHIDAFHDIWTVSYVLFGLHLSILGWLAWRSSYVPRLVGGLLVVAGAGYLIDTFGGLISTDYTLTVSAFSFVGEAVLMVWLLLKGRRVSLPATQPAR